MFNRAFRSALVACATFGLLLAVSEAAEATDTIRIDSRIAGSSVFTAADRVVDGLFEGKDAPGKSSVRTYNQLGQPGAPSARCQGFDFEIPSVAGQGAATFADGSQLYAVLTFGYVCGSLDGARRSVSEAPIVGGSGRFAGATGTATFVTEGVALDPLGGGGITAATGTIAGTARIDN